MTKIKFDIGSIASSVKKNFKDNDRMARMVSVGNDLPKLTEKDFLTMPKWWKTCTGVPGLPYGKIVMIAGDSDSGKTSAAIEAMKAAQSQDAAVLYVETEGKTTEQDLLNWGVDPSQIMLVQSGVAEEAFQLMFSYWDEFRKKYPTQKLLVIFDSLGNVVSQRDATMDLVEQSSKPGGKGHINRVALNKLVANRDENAATLIINYTYDNIGSPGKTNAGGKAVNFFSCLTFQTTRRGWLEKVVKGKKIRTGAEVTWKLFKNHLYKGGAAKEFTLQITSDGIECIE